MQFFSILTGLFFFYSSYVVLQLLGINIDWTINFVAWGVVIFHTGHLWVSKPDFKQLIFWFVVALILSQIS